MISLLPSTKKHGTIVLSMSGRFLSQRRILIRRASFSTKRNQRNDTAPPNPIAKASTLPWAPTEVISLVTQDRGCSLPLCRPQLPTLLVSMPLVCSAKKTFVTSSPIASDFLWKTYKFPPQNEPRCYSLLPRWPIGSLLSSALLPKQHLCTHPFRPTPLPKGVSFPLSFWASAFSPIPPIFLDTYDSLRPPFLPSF